MDAAQMKKAHANAVDYIGKIGRAEPHFRDGGGKISTLTVKTGICHQAAPSATNYWDDKDFDEALTAVIRAEFGALAAAALALMDHKYKAARIAEKANLLAALAEIEALEVGSQS